MRHTFTAALTTALIASTTLSCGDTRERGEAVVDQSTAALRAQRDRLAKKLEDEVRDYLVCAGMDRPNTLSEVASLLRDRDKIGLQELLMAPDNLAQLVGMAGATVEGQLLLARNLQQLAQQGLIQKLIQEGSAAISCGETAPVLCTSGQALTRAVCDGQALKHVEADFHGCMFGGTQRQGVVRVMPDPSDRSSLTFHFDDLQSGPLESLSGALVLDVDLSVDAQSFSLISQLGLISRARGGHDGAFSCGQTQTLNLLSVDRAEGELAIGLAGRRQTKDATYQLETFGDHLSWRADHACTCPVAGSGLRLGVPKPLGRADQVATLEVRFVPGASGCSKIDATLVDWPTQCSVTESVLRDCGKSAAEALLSPLLDTLCQPLDGR